MTESAASKRLKKNPIAFQVDAFEKEIDDIKEAIQSVKLDTIKDPTEKLSSIKLKLECLAKLGPVLQQLKELKQEVNENATFNLDTRGNTELSPLEQGLIN